MSDPPVVTIQLPIYNEMYVVDRLVDAVCEIDYPRDRLEIQVLDDSTDETREIAELAVRRQAGRGVGHQTSFMILSRDHAASLDWPMKVQVSSRLPRAYPTRRSF